MKIKELRDRVCGTTLDDVLLIGFVAQDETPAQFRAIRTAVYFEFDSTVVEFEAIESTGTMRIACVQSVRHSVVLDEDMVPAVASIREQILDDSSGTNTVLRVHLWDATTEEAYVRCSAAQIELANGQEIFLDPTYYFGIRLGDGTQKRIWLENSHSKEQERVLTLSKA